MSLVAYFIYINYNINNKIVIGIWFINLLLLVKLCDLITKTDDHLLLLTSMARATWTRVCMWQQFYYLTLEVFNFK